MARNPDPCPDEVPKTLYAEISAAPPCKCPLEGAQVTYPCAGCDRFTTVELAFGPDGLSVVACQWCGYMCVMDVKSLFPEHFPSSDCCE